MCVLQREPKRLGTTWHKYQMDVIGHQAVAHHAHTVECETLGEQIKIDVAIGIAVENKPASISTLRHVVGSVDCDHARQTGQGFTLTPRVCRASFSPNCPANRSPRGHAGVIEVALSVMHTIMLRG
jgi:hypothetical protein